MTPKNRNILLIIGFLLAFAIAYNLAFSETLASSKRINVLEIKTKFSENIYNVGANLEKREAYVDSILGLNSMKGYSVQNNLLEFLNSKSESGEYNILDFKEPHNFSEDSATTTSYRFTLGGSYDKIEHVLYTLEQEYNFGRIMHVHFDKKTNYRTRKDYLECFVIIESLVSE